MSRSLIIAVILLLGSAIQSALALTATQSVERVIKTQTADGVEQTIYEAANTVAPGDEIVYRLTFLNDGEDPADNIRLVMPVPAEVIYIENSATTDAVELTFSVDGGTTFSARQDLLIEDAAGSRPASSRDLTHVRWILTEPLAPGAEGEVYFHALVR